LRLQFRSHGVVHKLADEVTADFEVAAEGVAVHAHLIDDVWGGEQHLRGEVLPAEQHVEVDLGLGGAAQRSKSA